MKPVRLNSHKPGPWHREGLSIVDAEDKVVGRFGRAVDAEIAASAIEALWVLASLVMATAAAITRYEADKGPRVSETQLHFAATGALTIACAIGRKETPAVKSFALGYHAAVQGGADVATLDAELIGARRNVILSEASHLLPFMSR